MISAFELFKIGIGPSSSHTVAPMRAAARFAANLAANGTLARTARVAATLYGSLAWTGRGHGSDRAVILGLAGFDPETVDFAVADGVLARAAAEKRLLLAGRLEIAFDPATDIVLDRERAFSPHPNALHFAALAADGTEQAAELWFSLGGGFIAAEGEAATRTAATAVPFDFATSAEMLAMGEASGLTIAAMMERNEEALRPAAEVDERLDRIAAVMEAAVCRGLAAEGLLPGGSRVARRAKTLALRLDVEAASGRPALLEPIERVSLWAIAVSEENASGGRIVTAPTNGAAGVAPAVLRHARIRRPNDPETARTFLLAAAAVGALFKRNASISGAEVGCQGEVGVASSMAAAGLAAALGGSNAQVENAAEIAMEHHLGLTCDPVGGLVQIPCIERNAFGAVTSLNAAALALRGDGRHRVSLDQVIATMRDTGADMQSKYKETALGGLAVNVPNC